MHELSETVAQEVQRHRNRHGWTRKQLAERCQELGADWLTFSAITSIETGRPDETGRRRRGVTVDELAVLARALLVPPVVLMFPLHTDAEVTWSPGATAHPWHAIRWFSGEGRQPVKPRGGGEYDAATGIHKWYEEEPKDNHEQLDLLRRHERLIRALTESEQRAMNAHRFAELAQSPETRQARLIEADAEDLYRAQVIERDLINVRRAMRRAGLTPPTNDELDQLDRKDTNR
ncbi:helix-turn-helix domain-containing protein [Saccharothrix deserti]|uniref:helix-turn-helix domain-containing protein n=1 Tax=Saccharothrix deserti TaxID=2593674 RepID=UPI00131B7551|nr:helix-turn-helix transcriptional regulator [Saccharothrix deserti]